MTTNVDVFANEDLELTAFYWPEASRQTAEDVLKNLPVGETRRVSVCRSGSGAHQARGRRLVLCSLVVQAKLQSE
jgi:hypothetical protein